MNVESVMLRANAIMIRVEGMKADNKAQEHRGGHPMYHGGDFEHEACNMDALNQELIEINRQS